MPFLKSNEQEFGQQTPRRWGWGTPLKKRTATRIKSLYESTVSCQYRSGRGFVRKTARNGFYGTRFCGLPARNARTFSTAIFSKRERAARVAQAKWGVMIQFFARSNGLFSGGGSAERTSRPAPANLPLFKELARACSLMSG